MANNNNILGLANNTAALNFQIPNISIKLDRKNYSLWRSTILSALTTFDLADFVLSYNPPATTIEVTSDNGEITNEPNPEYQLWTKRDSFVLLWLRSTLTESALAIVARSSTAHEAWSAIDKTFQAQTRARRMTLKADLQTISKGSSSMLDYIERKRAIADTLAENLHPISTEDLIGHILTGLDSSYGPFITAYMIRDNHDSIDDLAGMLLQEESRLEQDLLRQAAQVPATPPPPTTVALTVNRSSNRSSSGTGSSNSYSPGSRSTDSRRRPRPQCQLCNKPGHEAVDCWQRTNQTDYPSRRPNPRSNQPQAHLAHHHSPSSVVDPRWYFDSGATDHVTPDLQKLNLTEEYNGPDKLQVGNGTNSSQRGR